MSKKCATCDKTVYAAEEIQADGKYWHKGGCFQCKECKTPLSKGQECSKKDDGRTLCKGCYAKLFGPKGVVRGRFPGGALCTNLRRTRRDLAGPWGREIDCT
jgi:hypothetical protein